MRFKFACTKWNLWKWITLGTQYSSIKLMYIHKKMYGFFNNSSINLKVKTNKQYIRIRVMGKLFLYPNENENNIKMWLFHTRVKSHQEIWQLTERR